MKKSILSASIAAMIGGLGFAGVASANVYFDAAGATGMRVNEAGTGHILLVPYFTTQGTNATLLNITNTDTNSGKLVKVRFRGASNSDDIFDFTLLLSPGDVWAAKVSQGADGVSRLETSDKSCTLPSTVATQANAFPTGRLNPALSAADRANETREGYVEILTMANVPKAVLAPAQVVPAGTTVNPLWTAIKHVNGVAPCTTAVLDRLLTNETSATIDNGAAADPTMISPHGRGYTFPTSGLMANWTIIDTVKTATFSGAAVAVQATGGNGNANSVFFPQSGDLVPGSVDSVTADPLLRRTQKWQSSPVTAQLSGFGATNAAAGSTAATAASTSAQITASFYDLPDLSTPYIAANSVPVAPVVTDALPILQARDLTRVLATTSVTNEFLTTTAIGATTDWVFSAPTRRYNVAFNYAYTSPIGGDGRVYTDWNVGAGTLSSNMTTGTDAFNYYNAANTALSGTRICVNADTGATGVNQWDREENTTSSSFVISPGTVTRVRFCGETSVLAINNGTNTSSGSLSAALATQNLNFTANEGWLSLGTSGLGGKGLPVTGGAFVKSSAFGAMWPHRYAR